MMAIICGNIFITGMTLRKNDVRDGIDPLTSPFQSVIHSIASLLVP